MAYRGRTFAWVFLFNVYFLGICYVPGTALGSRDIKTNKTQRSHLVWEGVDYRHYLIFHVLILAKVRNIFPGSIERNRKDKKWKTGTFQHLNNFIYEDIDKIFQTGV